MSDTPALTEQQVSAALASAGIVPVESPAAIAGAISAALAATAAEFAALPFAAEPPAFLAVLAGKQA